MERILENASFALGPVAMAISARRGYKSYLKFESIYRIILGSGLMIRPQLFTDVTLNTPLTPYHKFLAAWFGIHEIIYSANYLIFLRNSKDKSVYHGHHYFFVAFSTLSIFDNIYVYFEGAHWNYKILCFGTSLAVTNLFINAYYLLTQESSKPTGVLVDKANIRANLMAKVDFYLLLAFGIIAYAFPDSICMGLTASNESYRSIVRAIASMLVGASLQSLFVPEFKFLSDKKEFFKCRFIGQLLELPVILAGRYWYNALSTEGTLFFGSCALGGIISYGLTYFSIPNEEETDKKK